MISDQGIRNNRRAGGLFLVLGFVVNLIGVLMFNFSSGILGSIPRTTTFIMWERSLFALSVVLTIIGFVFLKRYLEASKGSVFAKIGAGIYLFAGVLIVVAEILSITLRYRQTYGVVTAYVILAFMAQACIGIALLQSGMVASWIGWGAILWNVAWLLVLPLISPRDIYFPILHHLIPLMIGIALLRQKS